MLFVADGILTLDRRLKLKKEEIEKSCRKISAARTMIKIGRERSERGKEANTAVELWWSDGQLEIHANQWMIECKKSDSRVFEW